MVVRRVRSDEGRVLHEVLTAIRDGGKPGAKGTAAISVRVLAAADHDGVCAAKIFSILLQRADVMFTLVPVTGNAEIITHIAELQDDTDVRSLVLLNCGAGIDLQKELEDAMVSPEVQCYVIDAHRPFALSNLSRRHTRVIVLDDDPIAEVTGMQPPEEEESSSESGDESNGDAFGPPEDGAAGPDSSGPPMPARRKRRREPALAKYERLERKRQRIREYYHHSYYATPASMMLFKMARQAAPPTQDLLWLAAVSLTGYHDLGLINEVEYSKMIWTELKEALDRIGDPSAIAASASSASQQSGGSAPPTPRDGQDSDLEGDAPPARLGHRVAPRAPPRKRSLRFDQDLRLTLYKHWTLEQSILHTSYLYGKLELHKDKGVRRMKTFFATVGISPQNYQQQYISMDLPVRKGLVQKFRDRGGSFGLSDKIFVPQFVKDVGASLGETTSALHLSELSSSDAASMIVAQLCAVPPGLSGAHLESLPQTSDGRRDMEGINGLEHDAMSANFWHAFNLVLSNDPSTLAEGVGEAVAQAKSVQSLARQVIDTQSWHLAASKRFRWCKVERPPHGFRHHLSLRQLAIWLLHVAFSSASGDKSLQKPLLLIVHDHVRDTYLCIGSRQPRHAERNEFGSLFRSVLGGDNSLKFRYDFFDKSVIEVSADDFERFWDALVGVAV